MKRVFAAVSLRLALLTLPFFWPSMQNSVDNALSKKTGYAIRRRIDDLLSQNTKNSTSNDAEPDKVYLFSD